MKLRIKLFNLLAILVATLSILSLTSCIEDVIDPDPKDEIKLVAAFTVSADNPRLEQEVTLDATGSFTESNTDFDVTWALESIPESSTTALADKSAITTTFTPDKVGEYTILLTITSDDGTVTDSETKSVTVLPGGYIELSGAIDEDRTLENVNIEDKSLIDYLVVGNVSVLAQLQIAPGVKIAFQEDLSLSIYETGTLIAEGTATDSILFTSSNEAGQTKWKGIYMQSGSSLNSISYAQISYAGNSNFDFNGLDYSCALGIEVGGKIAIENTSFSHNEGYSVYVDDDGGLLTSFESNHLEDNKNGIGLPASEVSALNSTSTFLNNTGHNVEIFSSSIEEAVETTWNALSNESAYTLTGDLHLSGTLNIASGAAFEADEDVSIHVSGAIIANGTEDQPVTFTSSDPNLLWKGIYISSSDSRNLLNYVNISNAGNSEFDFNGLNFEAAVGVDIDAKLSVTHSTFQENQGYALYIDDDGGLLETFSSNIFSNNATAIGLPADEVDALDAGTSFSGNSASDVEIFGSTYSSSKASNWVDLLGDASYLVADDIRISGDLTIDAGANFEFKEDVEVYVDSDGSISAVGTSSNRITFDADSPSQKWKGIYILSSSVLNRFEYADFSNAGNSSMDFNGLDYAAALGVDLDAKVSVTNSTFSNNADYGLYIDDDGGLLEDFENNTFTSNQRGVGLPSNEVDAMDQLSQYDQNSIADVEIFASTLSNSKNVTWSALSSEATYTVSGNLYITGNISISAGAAFELDEDVKIEISGSLNAEGSSANMITFTSSNSTGGVHWKGLFFTSSNVANALDYVEVSYGGNSNFDFTGEDFSANVGVDSDAQLSITNSNINQSSSYGIYSIGTTNSFMDAGANNSFANNVDGNSN